MAELNQIRRLNKKLRQIERLEGARRKLTLEERTKRDQKDEIRAQLKKLLKSEDSDTLNEEESPNNEVQKRNRAMTTVSTRLAQPDFKTSKKNNEEKNMSEEPREEKTSTGKPKAVADRHPCLRFKMESIEGNHFQITALAHHDELNLLAAGTHGAAINVYNLNENEKPFWLPGHRQPITKLDFLQKELENEIINSNQLSESPILVSASMEGCILVSHLYTKSDIQKINLYSSGTCFLLFKRQTIEETY